MDGTSTRQRLTQITDAGQFERLATAVLREVDPDFRRVAHIGVNKIGKTVKGPVDGIVYTRMDGERQMLAVHHTTRRPQDLTSKWLTDPDSDLTKTLRELDQQRERTPSLKATLVLTTNQEPSDRVLHDVEATSQAAGIDIRVWPGSALAHFLDFDPRGQLIRRTFLGVEPTVVSERLMRELSEHSIKSEPTAEDSELWVDRDVDQAIRHRAGDRVLFILGESGVGKTVTCLKHLRHHIREGGFGLVVNDDVLRQSVAIEEVVDRTLRKLQPSLAHGAGGEALALTSDNVELLLVVEDINQSAEAARLVQKLSAWNTQAAQQGDRRRWRILCPVWPRTMALARDAVRKDASESTVAAGSFEKKEGIAAAKRRRSGMTALEAEAVATALGFDPLLIALHGDSDVAPNPQSVIQAYIERALDRLAASAGSYTAGEYRGALRMLSLRMLKWHRLEPRLADVLEWMADEPLASTMLRELVRARDVVRLVGATEDERVAFRHDRVRDHLMAEAIAHAAARDELPDSVLSEPYFAEVIGMAVVRSGVASKTVAKVAEVNPLALFCALRYCTSLDTDPIRLVVTEAKRWVLGGAWRDPLQRALQIGVLRVLSECDGPHVRELCETIGEGRGREWALRGRFRNGDVLAGVQLCAMVSPGVRWAGYIELMDHVHQKSGPDFVRALANLLCRKELPEQGRRGALRLAGFVGRSELAGALRRSWTYDSSRLDLLSDYLWACAQCCNDEGDSMLEPIVDAWAMMPDEDEVSTESPRVRFGANELRWAFRQRVPERAIGYFLKRAGGSELRWPILVMLHGIDNPRAIEFVVREVAQLDERMDATESISPFATTAIHEWKERERYGGTPMSTHSRDRLLALWSCDANGKHLRRRALEFWCAPVADGDIPVLRTIDIESEIGSLALFERLRRGDRKAISALVVRLDGSNARYWWQAGRYLWTHDLTECLSRALARRADELADLGCEATNGLDWILSGRLVELPLGTAERLITQHWAGLRRSANYVKAALHIASPGLLRSVAEVVAELADPKPLFEPLGSGFGVGYAGRRGLTRFSQMKALLPYLNYVSEGDIRMLWLECNKNRWFEWRREHLDARARRVGTRFVDSAAAIKELDSDLDRERPLFWPDHWGNPFLETGVSLDEMMATVAQWLARRPQQRALSMAADLVTRFGKRRHLVLLERHTAAKSPFGQKVIRNADFELRLRSLD